MHEESCIDESGLLLTLKSAVKKAFFVLTSAPMAAAMPPLAPRDESDACTAAAQEHGSDDHTNHPLPRPTLNVSLVPGKASAYENSPETVLSEPTASLSTLKSPIAEATETEADAEGDTVALIVKVEPVFVGTLASTELV